MYFAGERYIVRHNIAEYDVIVSLNTKEVLKNEVNIFRFYRVNSILLHIWAESCSYTVNYN